MTEATNTRLKRLEASYFLDQMKKTEKDLGPFLFNLSAHLSATASILDILFYEFNRPKNSTFEAWLKSEDARLQQAGFKQFNCFRIRVVHNEGNLLEKIDQEIVKTGETLTIPAAVLPFNLTVGLPPSENGNYPIIDILDMVEEKWVWYYAGRREPVTATCERYLGILTKMVDDCYRKFGNVGSNRR